MKCMNVVVLSGNLARDAVLRTTNSGIDVLNFTIVVNEYAEAKDEPTGWKEYPNYIECSLYGNLASKIERKMTKGTRVALQGKLRYREYLKDDEKRNRLFVTVNSIEINAPKDSSDNTYAEPEYLEYDIPF